MTLIQLLKSFSIPSIIEVNLSDKVTFRNLTGSVSPEVTNTDKYKNLTREDLAFAEDTVFFIECPSGRIVFLISLPFKMGNVVIYQNSEDSGYLNMQFPDSLVELYGDTNPETIAGMFLDGSFSKLLHITGQQAINRLTQNWVEGII